MSNYVAPYKLFLPVVGVDAPCPEGRWRVTYSDGVMTLPVEVCAGDEETAIMRAGMKRAELTRLDQRFYQFHNPRRWDRVKMEVIKEK